MVLDSNGTSHPTLSHMRELIYKHDQREVHPQEMHTFHEGFTEVKVLGNSRSDLIAPIQKSQITNHKSQRIYKICNSIKIKLQHDKLPPSLISSVNAKKIYFED